MAGEAKKPTFNQLSGAIDRLFRFCEMMAVTSLFATVASTIGPNARISVAFIGTVLAVMYLTEPAVDKVGALVLGDNTSLIRLALTLAVLGVGLLGALFVAQYVSALALELTRTISLSAPQ